MNTVVVLQAAAVVALVLVGAQVEGCQDYISLIQWGEGYKPCAYMDSAVPPRKTICYGFNLDRHDSRAKVEAVGGNWDAVYEKDGCLTQSQCTELLNTETTWARDAAARVFGKQCTCIQSVLIDMTYNLGEGGVSKFQHMIAAVKNHDWAKAAAEAKNSTWCRQVKRRCTHNVDILKAGC